jgi:hypothetical protein
MLKNCVNCRGTGSWPWSQQPPLCQGDAQHHRAIYLWNPWPPLKALPLQEISDVFSSWQSITEHQPCQLLCSHTCWTSHAWATMFLSSGVHTNLVRTLWSRHLPEMHASMHKLSADTIRPSQLSVQVPQIQVESKLVTAHLQYFKAVERLRSLNHLLHWESLYWNIKYTWEKSPFG